jgi:hypothetical protein
MFYFLILQQDQGQSNRRITSNSRNCSYCKTAGKPTTEGTPTIAGTLGMFDVTIAEET